PRPPSAGAPIPNRCSPRRPGAAALPPRRMQSRHRRCPRHAGRQVPIQSVIQTSRGSTRHVSVIPAIHPDFLIVHHDSLPSSNELRHLEEPVRLPCLTQPPRLAVFVLASTRRPDESAPVRDSVANSMPLYRRLRRQQTDFAAPEWYRVHRVSRLARELVPPRVASPTEPRPQTASSKVLPACGEPLRSRAQSSLRRAPPARPRLTCPVATVCLPASAAAQRTRDWL